MSLGITSLAEVEVSQMADMNGIDAIIVIRDEFPDPKIIILTTYESGVQAAMKLGAQAYLLKTELGKELLGTITRRASAKAA